MFLTGCWTAKNASYKPVDWQDDIPEEPIKKVSPKETTSDKLLKLHNVQRKDRPLFVLDDKLSKYAQAHAEWMAKNDKLKHSEIKALLEDFHTVGENIAWNQRDEAEVVEGWMNSPGHRANILNKSFTKIGFGLAHNKDNEPYWCTCFGG